MESKVFYKSNKNNYEEGNQIQKVKLYFQNENL